MASGFENWKPYQYTPSIAAAVVFIVVFSIITIYASYQFFRALRHPHGSQLDRKRTLIIIPFIVGGIF